MANFAILPREVRDNIYQYCLVTANIIYPYIAYYEQEDGIKPYSKSKENLAIGLLGVKKSIQDEAATVLFGQNTWHLSDPSSGKRFPQLLWTKYTDDFRHVQLKLDIRDYHPLTAQPPPTCSAPTSRRRGMTCCTFGPSQSSPTTGVTNSKR